MDDDPLDAGTLSPRLLRAVELVYGLEGVLAARIWQWPGKVALGVRAAPTVSLPELLHRVEAVVMPLCAADEVWEFGALEDD